MDLVDVSGARYWAFLSYSHADEVQARRLHVALERYVLPRRARQAHSLPRRLFPIFRDVEELAAASGLTTRLQNALDESRWLIVLCSPSSAKSRYVNQEIEYFLGKHGPDRILCVLLGEPPECFPPAIRSLREEPLAADCRIGRDSQLARLKLVAALAGLGFTELRDREAQRRRGFRLAAAAALLAVAAGAFVYWDLLVREHVTYFVDYYRRDGIWAGWHELTAEMTRHRNQSYRFTRHGRLHPPSRVDLVSGQGACKGYGIPSSVSGSFGNADDDLIGSPACSAVFEYAENGSVKSQTLLNRNGAPVEVMSYTSPDVAQFTLGGFASSGTSTGIYYIRFERFADGPLKGLEKEIHFHFSRNNPRPDSAGAFGYRYDYDGEGRMTRQTALNEQGQGNGEAVVIVYDQRENIHEEFHQDGEGKPRQEQDGCYGYAREYDDWGNKLSDTCLGADGKPGLDQTGVSGRVDTFDAAGNVVQHRSQGADGKWASVDGVAEERREYDVRGYESRRSFFDEKGEPTLYNEGAHAWQAQRDAFGNAIEYRYVDRDGKPVCIHTGVCIWRISYDSRGNAVAQDYFDPGGKPQLIAYGAGMRVQFNEQNQVVEVTRLGLDGKPYLPAALGSATAKLRRDERGHVTERAFFDASGAPVMRKEGYAVVANRFDDLGNLVEQRYFDNRQRLVKNKMGFALRKDVFDHLGRVVEESYFDEHQHPVLHQDGYYGYRTSYDGRGRESERHYLGANGEPMRAKSGSYGVLYKRNGRGVVQEEIMLGQAGKAVGGRALARIEHDYDAYGREVELRYLSGEGRFLPGPVSGCAIFRSEYDSTGRTTLEACLDAERGAVNQRHTGWARKETGYESGRVISEKYFDAAGNPVTPRK